MRRLNFISVLEEPLTKNMAEFNKYLQHKVDDDLFIKEACTPLIKGGKRLRPMLFFVCSMLNNNSSLERKLPLAAAIELIHTASLIHDDILDQSKIRRGIPTANAKYGSQVSVLIGDYLFAKAFQLVAEGHYGDVVSSVLSTLVKDLCIGEISQDSSLFQIPTLIEYHKRIYLKTAIFLSSCCKLGGIVANLNEREIQSLSNYGSGLGIAFQIIDDLLDFFGDTKLTGKKIGGDLKSGVITLPVIRALIVSDERHILSEIVTKNDITDSEIERAIAIIHRTDAEEYCKNRAIAHIEAAKINLPKINTTVTMALEQIADFIIKRDY